MWGSGWGGWAGHPSPSLRCGPDRAQQCWEGRRLCPASCVLRVRSTCAGRAGLTPLVSERKGSWCLQRGQRPV